MPVQDPSLSLLPDAQKHERDDGRIRLRSFKPLQSRAHRWKSQGERSEVDASVAGQGAQRRKAGSRKDQGSRAAASKVPATSAECSAGRRAVARDPPVPHPQCRIQRWCWERLQQLSVSRKWQSATAAAAQACHQGGVEQRGCRPHLRKHVRFGQACEADRTNVSVGSHADLLCHAGELAEQLQVCCGCGEK